MMFTKQVTLTGREVMVFNKENRLVLIIRTGGKQGSFRLHAQIHGEVVDLDTEMKSIHLNDLTPVIEELYYAPSEAGWREILKPIARPFNYVKKECHETGTDC